MALLNRLKFNAANGTYLTRIRYGCAPVRPIWAECVELIHAAPSLYKHSDYTQLTLRVTPQGRIIWLKTLKSTASLYGWDKAFPTVIDTKASASEQGHFADPGRKGWTSGGGHQYRISRSPKSQGWPAGMTNSFRVCKQAANYDLVAIAKATTIDWAWMTCKYGGRRTKGWWLEGAKA